jgi:CxxC motif-containing protein (DUF1111 family)
LKFALAPPGGRLFGAALIALGLGLLAAASAPMLAGAQQAPAFVGAHDPGVRGGPAGAGGHLDNLTPTELAFFNTGVERFKEVDAVANGLGPRFNLDSCAGCHAQPDVGGSSPASNPQVNMANSQNILPSFITANGPVREVRFVHNPDGSPDGGVHDLFTIAGRPDAPPGCTTAQVLRQPNFAAQAANGNVIFRIPTPLFGAGLIESITDEDIIDNMGKNASFKSQLGISGRPNREGNTGTITRFGWKAQNKSLAIFAGEAYLVEQGVTNELFPQERGEPFNGGQRVEPPDACISQPTPDDTTNFDAANDSQPQTTVSDTVSFAIFGRFLAAPTPAPPSPSTRNGQSLFGQIGCAACHTPSFTTGNSKFGPALTNQPANLYSDLLVHNMGSTLADGVSQGGAGGDEFRTAPLWGLGQRIFLLHDGRTRDLVQAIEAHSDGRNGSSEANRVINNFNNLPGSSQQDILNFLRSL